MREYLVVYTGKELDSLFFLYKIEASNPKQAVKAYLRHIHQDSTIEVHDMDKRTLGAIPASALSTYDTKELLRSTKLNYRRENR